MHNKLRLHLILNTHRHQQLYYHHLNQLVLAVENQLVLAVKVLVVEVLVVEVLVEVEVDTVEVVVAEAEEYSQVVGDRVVVVDGRGLVEEDDPEEVIRGVVVGQVEVVGDQVAVVGFSLVVDIIAEHRVDGLSLNQVGVGDIAEHNPLF